MHANDLAYIPHFHFVARVRDGRSTKTSDLLKERCFLMSKTYLWFHNIKKDFYK